MTPKERAAMQQALEALEIFGTDDMAYIKSDRAITALREALAEPQVDWYEEAMRLAGLNAKHVGELRKLESEQAEQEPVAWVTAKESFCGFPKLVFSETQKNGYKPLYAAPVRTKDLTDAFINELHKDAQDPISFARAVIAADREKNNPLTKSNKGE